LRCLLAVLLVVLGARADAQAPPAKAEAPAPVTATDTYTYDPGGRRDPFLSLIGTGGEPHLGSSRTEGVAGLTVGEISVRGIVESRGVLIAMVQGPDKKTYLVHQGDRFVDGMVKSITPQGLVFLQQVSDPLSLIKEREIRKPLRTAEGSNP
jgi:hypothetical protein